MKRRGGAREGSGVAGEVESGLVGVVRLLSREWEDSVMVAREAGRAPGTRESRFSRVVWDWGREEGSLAKEEGRDSNSSSWSSENEGSGETSRIRGGSIDSAAGAGERGAGDVEKGGGSVEVEVEAAEK